MELSTSTNPETETVEVEAAEVETPDEQTLETEAEAPEGEEAAEEEEELDIDGNPLKVPKTLAEKLKARMMMQADYTQKTQTLAEQRREYEAQRQAFEAEEQVKRELFNEEAQLFNVRQRLQAFQNVNWTEAYGKDPQRAGMMQAEYTQLKDFHDRLNGHVENRRTELAKSREQETAIARDKAIAEAFSVLNKPDPELGWDGKIDDEKARALTDAGIKFGYSNEELIAANSDPRAAKVLNLARLGLKYLEAQRKAPQRPAAEPAAKVPAAKSPGHPRDPEKMTYAQYAAGRKSGRIK
jgi:hypothetical protein